jgi:hypothetical protein
MALCAKDLDDDGRLEVLLGTEDRNIYVLDDDGKLRWRYVLYHSVLALETADIDNDGRQEILAGCANGVLYVFTSAGDLTWKYETKDRIQTLRVDDIDQDGNVEIVMVEENHLEVLRVVNQQELTHLIALCWELLLAERNPLMALQPLITHSEPMLRAAALIKLAELEPVSPQTLDILSDAMKDSFTYVRKNLPEALMYTFPADPVRTRLLLTALFTERLRDVRIEVVEHLELLARHDWQAVQSYLERALDSDDRHTRRAVVRKIAHLLQKYGPEIKNSQATLGENILRVLLVAARDTQSTWVRQEAGRVLAAFLNLFKEEFWPYLYRLFENRLDYETLSNMAYNLSLSEIRQAVVCLLSFLFDFNPSQAETTLATTAKTFQTLSSSQYAYSLDLWLLFRELGQLFHLNSIEDLSEYEFHLKPEQFQTTAIRYPHTVQFLRIGEQLHTVMHPLKISLQRYDDNDKLNSLLESIAALEALQRLVDREYGVSPLPGAPLPNLPEFVLLKTLFARWQELFSAQRNKLHGHADIKCSLQSRSVHQEEVVGIWLRVANQGRALAREVKVTLLSDKSFTTTNLAHRPAMFEALLANQETGAEFLIRPVPDANSVTLTFEATYETVEHETQREIFQERLNFVERPQTFTRIENPYSTGTLTQDINMCYGRGVSLAYLQDNLTRNSAQTVLVLYGQRRSGKTTLLNQLAKTGLLDRHIPVMIDLQEWTYNLNVNRLLFAFADKIFKALHKRGFSLPEPQRRDFFGPSEDPMFSFGRFLDKVETLLERQKLILLLDEFEELEHHVNKGNLEPEIFRYLRSLMQKRQYIHFLLSGTHQIEKLTRDYWSVFFNIALHYPLPSRISPEGAEELIREPVIGSLEYEPQVVHKIRLLTADQPYMIHLLCRELVDHCNKMEKNYATLNDVNLVLKNVFTTGTVHFDWLWERFEPKQQRLLQIIAEGVKDEERMLDKNEIRKLYGQYHYFYDQDEVTDSLKELRAEDVIDAVSSGEQQDSASDDTRYTIANGLFRQWLKQNKRLNRRYFAGAEHIRAAHPLRCAPLLQSISWIETFQLLISLCHNTMNQATRNMAH